MLQIMRAIYIARKAIYFTLFACLAWRKCRAEQYWLRPLFNLFNYVPFLISVQVIF